MVETRSLRLASRQSDLARIQAREVGAALEKAHPSLRVEFHFSESLGDKNLTDPLWKMPGKGVFTEDLSADLNAGRVDLVVHSWKDLPVEEKPETEIVATLKRADVRDMLVFKKSSRDRLKRGEHLRIFSSSPRREYNLKPFLREYLPGGNASLEFQSVRGNIPTRLRKLIETADVDGLIVAKAALDRILATTAGEFREARERVRASLDLCDWMVLPLTQNPAAAAQGALAIEIRRDRPDLRELLKPLHDERAFREARREREVLKSHGGGCHQKIGATVLIREFGGRTGSLLFLRGLTEAGLELREKKFEWADASPAAPAKVLRSDWLFERASRSNVEIPSSVNALFVSHAFSWPSEIAWTGILWTAGLATWKKMASQGHWVNGSSESLGETEAPRIEQLAPHVNESTWGTLTNSLAGPPARGVKIVTYDLKPRTEAEWPADDRLHWTSGVLFDEAVRRWPELRNRKHSCGPGKTFEHLRALVKDVEIRWPADEESK